MIFDTLAKFIILHPPYRFLPKWFVILFWYSFLEVDRWALRKIEFWSREKLDEIQLKRLYQLLKSAKLETDFWKDKIIGPALHDPKTSLQSAPILTREILKQNSLELFSPKTASRWRREKITTSGTTGIPGVFNGDKLAILRMEAMIKQILGFKDNSRLVRLNLNFPPYRPLGNLVLFSYATDEITAVKRMKEALGHKPTHIFGPTSSLLDLANLFADKKILYSFKSARVVGEHLLKEDREFLELVLGCPVYNIYASREALGPIAYECKEKKEWHINTASFMVDIADESGKELPNGQEGNIILTAFDNEIMPLIRYKIGDTGHIETAPCPCGRQGPRLSVKGRKSQMVIMKNGKTIPIISVVGLIRNYIPFIDQFRFAQKEPGEIIAEIATRDDLSKYLNQIHQAAQRRFGDKLRIKIECCKRMEGKNILFRNELTRL